MSAAKEIFDYTFDKLTVSNPDGTSVATVKRCKQASNPGSTPYGAISKVLRFSATSSIVSTFPLLSANPQQFCARVIFWAKGAISARQDLLSSNTVPFSIHLLPGADPSSFHVECTVHNSFNGWSGANTLERVSLKPKTWHAVDLVYDVDTLGLFVDQNLISLSAFPVASLAAGINGKLTVGVNSDLTQFHFLGDIQHVVVFSGIPDDLQSQLDINRGNSEWFIRRKENQLNGSIPLGSRKDDIVSGYAGTMDAQVFEHGLIAHSSGYPDAFEMHGEIYARYIAGNLGVTLGALVSNQMNARLPGSRKSVFEKGAIYWSSANGAHEVLGQMYVDYDRIGGSISVVGLPSAPPLSISAGLRQVFQHGEMYYRNGATNAFEVHGAILARFLATGGAGTWGCPTSNETDVLSDATKASIGRQNSFERCTILWSPPTDAHIIYGAIRDKYLANGGPTRPLDQGGLGFPTSDEQDIPGVGGFARFNTFERGSILFNGTTVTSMPFRIYLGYLDTEEDEGVTQGQNDLYVFVELWENGSKIFGQRYPDDGSWGGDNSHNLDITLPHEIVPNRQDLRLELKVDVWDEDGGFGGDDDHLGMFTKVLDVSNAWGLFDNAAGIFKATNVDGIKSLDWSLHQVVPPNTPKDFWGVGNQGTPTLSYVQYGEAFSDIDDDPDWGDLADSIQEKFYSDTIQGAAAGGNCLGMCIEALDAWSDHSLFSLPLSKYTQWADIVDNVNIKQIYWYGSDAAWFTDNQIKNQNLSPQSIFTKSRQSANNGAPAIIYFFTNSNFSGTGHAVLALFWDDSSVPWKITVFDPNNKNAQQTVQIFPGNGSFFFSSGGTNYGGAPGQGAIGYLPYTSVNHRQTSPCWDPLLLLIAGAIVALGADSQTQSIVDSYGRNLWYNQNESGNPHTYSGQFRSHFPLNGQLRGEVLMRRVKRLSRFWEPAISLSTPLSKIIHALTASREPQSDDSPSQPISSQPISGRLGRFLIDSQLPASVLAQSLQEISQRGIELAAPQATKTSGRLKASASARLQTTEKIIGILADALRQQGSGYGADYVHRIRGKRRGRFNYFQKYRLAQTTIQSPIYSDELHELSFSGLGGSQPITSIKTEKDKLIQIEHLVRLGRSADFIKVRISDLPVRGGVDSKLSVKPGLAAIDLLTVNDPVNLHVQVETSKAGISSVKSFTIPLKGGLRLLPATVLSDSILKTGRISTLFGNISDTSMVSPT